MLRKVSHIDAMILGLMIKMPIIGNKYYNFLSKSGKKYKNEIIKYSKKL